MHIVGGYEILAPLGSGGMASVHLGRLTRRGGFERLVAIKICHRHLRADDAFVRMFLDEARLAARIHHPNVVATLDVDDADELYLVMEYVEGGRLSELLQHGALPTGVALRIVADVLAGLHAAHELSDADGRPLSLVHRDVSPQNVLVGVDGLARLADFGVAKAEARLAMTVGDSIKGKLGYMAPEQFHGKAVTRRTDVFAAGVVAWEALAGVKLFIGRSQDETAARLLSMPVPAPSVRDRTLPPELDAVILRALSRDAADRWPTAFDMASALEACGAPLASARDVARVVAERLGPQIAARRALVSRPAGAPPPDLDLTTPDRAGTPERPSPVDRAREASRASSAAADAPGSKSSRLVAGRFELRDALGAGAMGAVRRAWDRLLSRDVALKMVHGDAADAELRERLLAEGRAVARIDHPNVVRVFDVVPDEAMLVLELVQGESLATRLLRGALPADEALRIARDVARGLRAAHALGVIHRDLKPANVLLDLEGHAKIADFGIALMMRPLGVDGLAETALTPGAAGTPPYMAPEQRRRPSHTDERSDLYALGLLVYEMATGRRYHDGEGRVVEVHSDLIGAGAGTALAAVCARCLAEEPADRWPSAAALLEVLDALGPESTPSRVTRHAGDRPLPWPLERSARADQLRAATMRVYGLDRAAESAVVAIATAHPDWADACWYLALTRAFGLAPRDDEQSAFDAALAVETIPFRRTLLEVMDLFGRGDHARAAALATESVPGDCDNWEALYVLGEALTHAGDMEGGYVAFQRAHALGPHFLLPWLHAGDTALARLDETALSRWVAAFDQHEVVPDVGPALHAWWRMAKGDPWGALARLGDVSGRFAMDARIPAHAMCGDWEGARNVASGRLDQLWRGDPHAPDATSLAWIAFGQGRHEESERWLGLARSKADQGQHGSAVWIHSEQSMAYTMTGRLDAGHAAFERARSHIAVHRGVRIAAALLAWRTRDVSLVPDPAAARMRWDRTVIEAVAMALAGERARAVARIEEALARVTDTHMLIPGAWVATDIARGVDEPARARISQWIVRPRRPWSTWIYARSTCD